MRKIICDWCGRDLLAGNGVDLDPPPFLIRIEPRPGVGGGLWSTIECAPTVAGYGETRDLCWSCLLDGISRAVAGSITVAAVRTDKAPA